MQNKEMTLLKALGIIFVVMGHKYEVFSWFQVYSFHMALFFFVSGYFYKEESETNILSYIYKKVKKTIPIYFLFNFIYMIVTNIINKKYNVSLANIKSFKDFFIMPFISGHQVALFLPAWFMMALLIIQVIFIMLYKNMKKVNKNMNIHLLIFICIGFCGTYIAKYTQLTFDSTILIVVRTCFGLFFYYLGFYYRKHESNKIFNSKILFVMFLIQIVILIQGNDIKYVVVWGQFHGAIILPYIIGINGIYLYLFISKALAKLIPDNDVLYKIGSHTMSIMMHHMFVFFIINYVIVKVTNGDRGQLGDVWFSYNLNTFWPIYIGLGVLLPVISSILIEKIKIYILKLNKNYKYI